MIVLQLNDIDCDLLIVKFYLMQKRKREFDRSFATADTESLIKKLRF